MVLFCLCLLDNIDIAAWYLSHIINFVFETNEKAAIPRRQGVLKAIHVTHKTLDSSTLKAMHYNMYIFTPMKLCLPTATHNFKSSVTITHY